MTVTDRPAHHADAPEPSSRRTGELTARELLRWSWRQITSMRTALILLLLLALAAIPGSVIPQQGVDALKTSNWQAAHPTLTPIYERLQLFSVYDSAWFSAIYLLLMLSLIGCIVPRCLVYARALRSQPPATPRNLARLPDHDAFVVAGDPDAALERARAVLKKRRYRLRDDGDAISAERGYLREAGNLLFHLSVLIVLVGFAMGGLFGYKGGVIVLVGGGFSNVPSQYDDFDAGSLFDADAMEPFSFTIDSFDATWLTSGPRTGMARDFVSELTYQTSLGAADQTYDLRVNHPLKIGGTEIFLIGHGYAPVITVRDAQGNVSGGPTVFLPLDTSFRSIGVVKAPGAEPEGIGLSAELYPTVAKDADGLYYSAFGNSIDPLVSTTVWTGDLGMGNGSTQSVYDLDTRKMTLLTKKDGSPVRLDLKLGQTKKLPDGLGSVTFEGLQRWNKVQISRTPGAKVALAGVSLALLGLLGSLFIRPRRVWVRVRRRDDPDGPDGPDGPDEVEVELAGLDRSGGGDVAAELATIRAALAVDDPLSVTSGRMAGNRSGDRSKEDSS